MTSPHVSVLPEEVSQLFSTLEDGLVVDCTTGFAGHSERILQDNPNIQLMCIDRDDDALAFAKKRLEPFKERVRFVKAPFSKGIVEAKGEKIIGVLADLGVSSFQLDEMERGFSFNSETLDMRMDKTQELSAYEVVNHYSLSELEFVLKEFGEERNYKKIAKLIVDTRLKKPIESSIELAELIAKVNRGGKINPATLTFQGIRIEVNAELSEVKTMLEELATFATTGCLVGIISFHSLEDRIVKTIFKEWSKKCICPQGVFRCECGNNNQKGKVLTKKPIIPTREEIKNNPRSRSSKLRAFRFE